MSVLSSYIILKTLISRVFSVLKSPLAQLPPAPPDFLVGHFPPFLGT